MPASWNSAAACRSKANVRVGALMAALSETAGALRVVGRGNTTVGCCRDGRLRSSRRPGCSGTYFAPAVRQLFIQRSVVADRPADDRVVGLGRNRDVDSRTAVRFGGNRRVGSTDRSTDRPSDRLAAQPMPLAPGAVSTRACWLRRRAGESSHPHWCALCFLGARELELDFACRANDRRPSPASSSSGCGRCAGRGSLVLVTDWSTSLLHRWPCSSRPPERRSRRRRRAQWPCSRSAADATLDAGLGVHVA